MAAARAALAGGNTGAAIAEYRQALDAAPEVAEVRLALADLLVQDGSPVEYGQPLLILRRGDAP